MTIGFDAKRAFYNKTGLGSYSRTVLNVLSKFYPENTYKLFCPKQKKTPAFDLQKQYPTVWSSSAAFSFLWRSFFITKNREFEQLDLYHGLSGEIPFGKTSVPLVVTIHDLIFLRLPELYNPLDVRIYNFKSRYAVQNSQIVISISEATKRDILTFYNINPEKIQVVYQSYNPIFNQKFSDEQKAKVRQKYGLPNDYILYVGTIEKRKNLLSLLKAVEIARLDIPVVAVGRFRSDYKPQILEFLSKSPVSGQVYFVHNVEFSDLPAIYQSALVFVYPSIYEGFGIPVIEAQQSGVPVITSNVSSLPEAAGPHSVLVDPTGAEQIADGLKKLLFDETYRNQVIEQGYRYVQRFSPENFAKGLMKVYREVTN